MPESPFDHFVVFAEMRTGSNLLEANMNEYSSIVSYGEAFNRHFIGKKGKTELLGVTMAQREADPLLLIRRMIEETKGLPGFRFFHDHDPRVLAACMANPRCAKVILTRNPVESYISLKIATQTDQWTLTDIKHQRSARARFDAVEFEHHLEARQAFQVKLLNALQTSGQTAFYLDYEDIPNVAVMNGLIRFLGLNEDRTATSSRLKKQNPEEIADKVVNAAEMAEVLSRLDRFNLSRTPNFEPRRGPAIPSFLAAADAPLLYMPVKAGPEEVVADWLSSVGGGLVGAFTQKTLRQWKRKNAGHRSFTVLRHPVARAHVAFHDLLSAGVPDDLRLLFRKVYKLDLPPAIDDPGYDLLAHRTAFLAFLKFLKANLSGQTSLRTDPAWASQTTVLQGFAQFTGPDVVLREERLAAGLSFLCAEVGMTPTAPSQLAEPAPFPLASVHDAEIEAAARDAYQRDYMAFGYSGWSPQAA